jgi:3-hydroxyisobutyrate dehydrogenase-like beta-hydroxyacid dehydrogenase
VSGAARAGNIRTIGLIGLGKMGAAMARHLVGKGFAVRGHDVDPEAAQRCAADGVALAASPAEAAQGCELVIVVTAFEHQVEEAIFGPSGVAAGATRGTIVGVAATISPQGMCGIAGRLESRGLVALDIPLCRGEPAAEAGQLLIVGGGDKAAFDRCRGAFSAFADAIFHLGPAGAGQTGKMVNNLILWACISANYEGLKLGEALGVDRGAMREMLLASSAENWPLRSGAGERPMPWAEKDMMIVLAEADSARLSLPLSGALKEVIKGIKVERGE